MSTGGESLLILDAYNLLYRAYHALPPMRAPDGSPTNALYGFARMTLALVEELGPTRVAVAIDEHGEGPTFREEMLPEYKAQRAPMPEDLVRQLPRFREVCRALGIPVVGVPGFEADDVMGTLAREASAHGLRTYLATGDKDVYQLVSDSTFVCTSDKGFGAIRQLGPEDVREALGVGPELVVDWKSLTGDSSDNVRGAEGIGPKKATALLEQFGSLEEMLARTGEIANPRMRASVEAATEVLVRNRVILRIRDDVPIAHGLDDLVYDGPNREAAREVFRDLGFTSFAAKLGATTPVSERPRIVAADAPELRDALAGLRGAGPLALLARWLGGRPIELALATKEAPALVVTLGAAQAGTLDLFADEAPVFPAELRALLEDASAPKVCFDAKLLLRGLEPLGVTLAGVEDDLGLMAYVTMHGEGGNDVPHLASRLGADPIAAIEDATSLGLACARLHGLRAALAESLQREGLAALYREVEFPVLFVLARMEARGICVDREGLATLGQRLDEGIARLEAQVHELAGGPFLIASPQQLQVVLFDKLGLASGKKTKTGFSTDAATLEALEDEHPIIAPILEWRQLTKLRSTYVDALLRLADRATGRVHTCYYQRSVVTGRLASSDPNLQNIPVRSEWGREVRKCFTAPAPGWLLLACDYNQIELRILAHFSRDPMLLEAFREGRDIHTHTASLLYGVALEEVSRDQRAAAKAVNFGIVYGMGSQRLAADLGMERAEAKAFIEHYLAHYGGIKSWVEETKRQASELGFVATLTGRRRNLPELRSPRPQLRAAAERMAVNTPIQGSAADIMKWAMLAVDRALEGDDGARMLLQVHDELVFEVREDRLGEIARRVEELMGDAATLPGAAGPLEVPLTVGSKAGANWGEMLAVR